MSRSLTRSNVELRQARRRIMVGSNVEPDAPGDVDRARLLEESASLEQTVRDGLALEISMARDRNLVFGTAHWRFPPTHALEF